MTWIKTVPVSEDEKVRKASESQRDLYPVEYATPVHPTRRSPRAIAGPLKASLL
jgi:hypothetical protein